jgi:uncharacterized protein YjbI with pentapeptide repeats
MQVFLSYNAEDRHMAEQVQLTLIGAGHHVFFDKESLPPSCNYHARIRDAVQQSDLFVFLISPLSVAQGSYTLTELKYAREKWPHPKGRVIPVIISATAWDTIPNYLKAVTLMEPEGNVPAELLAAMDALIGQANTEQRRVQPKTLYRKVKAKLKEKRWVAGVLLTGALVGGAFAFINNIGDIAGLFSAPEAAIDTAARDLAGPSPELRVIAAKKLARVGMKTEDTAEKSILVLTTFLHHNGKIPSNTRHSQERGDVAAALQALGEILRNADKKGWVVKRPYIERLNFSGFDLPGLYLRGISISHTSFEDAILSDADLSQATLSNVRLDGAQGQKLNLSGTQIKWSCMERMDLTNADLHSIESWDSDFNRAILEEANLSGARLRNTNVAYANFGGSDLSSTDLSDALEVGKDQIEKARSTRGAKLPERLYKQSKVSVCGPRN